MRTMRKIVSVNLAVRIIVWCFVASWMLAMFSLLSDPGAAREGSLLLRIDFLTLIAIALVGTIAVWRIDSAE